MQSKEGRTWEEMREMGWGGRWDLRIRVTNGIPELKEESEKVGLKFNIQKAKIMASGPIT